MSTSALIQIDDCFFRQSHDGYPPDVVDELQKIVKEAQEKAQRNPDMPFMKMMQHLMREYEYDEVDSHCDCCYFYEVMKNGTIEVQNEDENMVGCRFENGKCIISRNGEESVWESWDEYEESL